MTDQIFGRRYGEFQYVCSSDQIAAKECFSDVDMYQLFDVSLRAVLLFAC